MSYTTVTVQQARDNLAELIERAALANEEFLVTKFGKPKVAIVAADRVGGMRQDQMNRRRRAIKAFAGIWANRKDMVDSAKWVADLRRRESMRNYSE
jgi:prevent-host-death family protein